MEPSSPVNIPDYAAGYTSHFVETNGIRLHYWRSGGDKPPVILLHGITDSGLCWRRVAQVLAPDYDLFLVDSRGHGLSDKPETDDYSLEIYAADTAGLIEALGLGKASIIGHSLGGGIGSTLAASRPDLVCALVLEDPPWRLPAAQNQGPRLEEWREQTRLRKATMTHAQIVALGKNRSTTWHDDEFDPWAQAKLDVSEYVFSGLSDSLNRWPELAPKIQCPTLLVGGDPELDGIISAEAGQLANELNPKIEYVHIGGAGHNVRREQFEPFVEHVRAFLGRHAATEA